MKILKINKDSVQMELTKHEIEDICWGFESLESNTRGTGQIKKLHKEFDGILENKYE